MTIFPIQKHSIESPLSPTEVYEIIASKTTDKQPIFPPAWKTHSFWGEMQPNGFHIYHIPDGYHNSFSPQITGKITAANPGSSLNISMELTPIIRNFIVIWYGSMVSMVLFGLLITFTTQSFHPVLMLMPPGMLIFMYLLTHHFFKLGCKAALQEIKQLLK